MTGAQHSLIMDVYYGRLLWTLSMIRLLTRQWSPPSREYRSLEPGHTTAHRRHLAAAILGKIGCRPSRNPMPPYCAGAWALRPRDRSRQTYAPILHAPSITR
jgi:hypothetical protein